MKREGEGKHVRKKKINHHGQLPMSIYTGISIIHKKEGSLRCIISRGVSVLSRSKNNIHLC